MRKLVRPFMNVFFIIFIFALCGCAGITTPPPTTQLLPPKLQPAVKLQPALDGKVVVDHSNGLMWQTQDKVVTLDEAQQCCHNNYAGLADWRLPTPGELLALRQALISLTGGDDAITRSSFFTWSHPEREYYWSSDSAFFLGAGTATVVAFGPATLESTGNKYNPVIETPQHTLAGWGKLKGALRLGVRLVRKASPEELAKLSNPSR